MFSDSNYNPQQMESPALSSVSVFCRAIRVVTCENTERKEIFQGPSKLPVYRMMCIRYDHPSGPQIKELKPLLFWNNCPVSDKKHEEFLEITKKYPREWCCHTAIMISIEYLLKIADVPLTPKLITVELEQTGDKCFENLNEDTIAFYMDLIKNCNVDHITKVLVTADGQKFAGTCTCGMDRSDVLYQQASLEDKAKVFLDPNTFSADGTIALMKTTFSDGGNYLAYGLSESGSDWLKIYIRDVEAGTDFDEVLENVKFSKITWSKNNTGFFYSRYPDQDGKKDGSDIKQNENQKLYYHLIGQKQIKDLLIVEFSDHPSWTMQSFVTDCGKYLIVSIMKDCYANMLYYAEIEDDNIKAKPILHKIIDGFEYIFDYITNEGSKVFLRTNKNAPKFRLIAIDITNPDEENWTTITPHEQNILDHVLCVCKDKFMLLYIRNMTNAYKNIETGEFNVAGSINYVCGKKEYTDIFYTISSCLNPGTIFYYDFATPEQGPIVVLQIELNRDAFNWQDYKVEQVFYESKDATKIPMFIIRKNRPNIEPRPCLLYGYGGFNISLLPSFNSMFLTFLDTFDGVLAYPNLRGGGEYGESWHSAGRLLNKQNVFDDFQAAAEYLIKHNYTTKDRLAIQGNCNGGLLIGACINQRPDLFGVAVAQVGVMDMLPFHKFTVGHNCCSDFGNPEEKENFENLYKYSPLHNVHTPKSPGEEYPATLILTADHDDRVSPLHSFKYAAALQDAVRDCEFQKNPILLRIYCNSGHGAGKPTSKCIVEAVDVLTFMYKNLKIDTVNL